MEALGMIKAMEILGVESFAILILATIVTFGAWAMVVSLIERRKR